MASAGAAFAQTIGINGGRFTVDGQERFLTFVSYFDSMDVPDANAHADFAQLRSWGVDGIRIFPNWWTWSPSTYAGDTLIDHEGNIRESTFGNMLWYLDRAREYGLIVDVSFSAETVSDCVDCSSSAPASLTLEEAERGIEEVARRLSGYRNLIFDVQNESNIHGPLGQGLDENGVWRLVQAVRRGDSSRIVTASVDQHGHNFAASRANNTGQDVVAWHEWRDEQWWFGTYDWVRQIKQQTGKPVYLQEPLPYDGEWWYTADGLKRAIEEAKKAGAAAWTFHTRKSFVMNNSGLLANIGTSGPEYDFLRTFKAHIDSVSWGW